MGNADLFELPVVRCRHCQNICERVRNGHWCNTCRQLWLDEPAKAEAADLDRVAADLVSKLLATQTAGGRYVNSHMAKRGVDPTDRPHFWSALGRLGDLGFVFLDKGKGRAECFGLIPNRAEAAREWALDHASPKRLERIAAETTKHANAHSAKALTADDLRAAAHGGNGADPAPAAPPDAVGHADLDAAVRMLRQEIAAATLPASTYGVDAVRAEVAALRAEVEKLRAVAITEDRLSELMGRELAKEIDGCVAKRLEGQENQLAARLAKRVTTLARELREAQLQANGPRCFCGHDATTEVVSHVPNGTAWTTGGYASACAAHAAKKFHVLSKVDVARLPALLKALPSDPDTLLVLWDLPRYVEDMANRKGILWSRRKP